MNSAPLIFCPGGLLARLHFMTIIIYRNRLVPRLAFRAQLPILLSEYVFRNKQDVHNYLKLLEQLPAYFSEIADFEQLKADSGTSQ